jgi:hypothetical protein
MSLVLTALTILLTCPTHYAILTVFSEGQGDLLL